MHLLVEQYGKTACVQKIKKPCYDLYGACKAITLKLFEQKKIEGGYCDCLIVENGKIADHFIVHNSYCLGHPPVTTISNQK